MDQGLIDRFTVYEEEKLASPAVVTCVRDLLRWLEAYSGHACTEESAGPLASHLMLALNRVQAGETLDAAWDETVHAEAEKLHALDSWAKTIQQQVQQHLGISLPDEEIDFVLLHLGTFLVYYHDPLVSHIVA